MSYNFNYSSLPTLTSTAIGYTISQSTPVTLSGSLTNTFIETIPMGVYILNLSGYIESDIANTYSAFFYKAASSIITSNSTIAVFDTIGTTYPYRGIINIIHIWNNPTSQNIYVTLSQSSSATTAIFNGTISATRIA